MNSENPKVGILMGSKSDKKVMEGAIKTLNFFGVSYEVAVVSAHRCPDHIKEYSENVSNRGLKVIIAGAGMAAHLAGAVAANTVLPVIGVPIASGPLNGVDALYSTVQMPTGIPVATVAINGAKNAAFLACQIIANEDIELMAQLIGYRRQQMIEILSENE
jgi:5-(carboxyamino)imidazole ribonucleotide mutase